MACAVTISAVTLVHFTVVFASHDTCKIAVLSDTQLREEIRNEVNEAKFYSDCNSTRFLQKAV